MFGYMTDLEKVEEHETQEVEAKGWLPWLPWLPVCDKNWNRIGCLKN